MKVGITSTACHTQRTVSRNATVTTAATTATTIHPRAISDAPSALPMPPPLISRETGTPAALADWITTIASAVTSQSGARRSASRCTRNEAASSTPCSSGWAVVTMKTSAPRQIAAARVAVK